MLTLTNSSRHELLKVNIVGRGSSRFITPVAFTADTYTVKIENPMFKDYALHLVPTLAEPQDKD